jgi:hypothetical protein
LANIVYSGVCHVLANKTSLIPPLCIEGPWHIQEIELSCPLLLRFYLLDFGTVKVLWYLLFFFLFFTTTRFHTVNHAGKTI